MWRLVACSLIHSLLALPREPLDVVFFVDQLAADERQPIVFFFKILEQSNIHALEATNVSNMHGGPQKENIGRS